MSSYSVRLVAVSGREQPVLLKIRRDGLWLFTEHGKEIQQLPYQHIVKWLPSKMRSRDPGPEDCLDIQVETASGKKDLRMRCQSVPAVQGIISDIRQTVQAIMAELDPSTASKHSPLKAGLAAAASGSNKHGASEGKHEQHNGGHSSFDSFARRVSDSEAGAAQSPGRADMRLGGITDAVDAANTAAQAVAACAAGLTARSHSRSPSPSHYQPQQQQQQQQQQQRRDSRYSSRAVTPEAQQQQQQHVSPSRSTSAIGSRTATRQSLQSPQQQQQQQQRLEYIQQQLLQQQQHEHYDEQQQQQHASGAFSSMKQSTVGRSLSRAGATSRLLDDSKEMELEFTGVRSSSPGRRVELGRVGLSSAGVAPMRRSTGELGGFTGEAAAQVAFLEDMVHRLSHELSNRLAEDPQAAMAAAAGASMVDSSLLDSTGRSMGGAATASLPPWMRDSRYLNPLLSAYDQRLTAAQAELAAKTDAVRDIKTKVRQLVEENEALHDRLAEQASKLEGRAGLDAAAAGGADQARLQERLELLEHENDLLVSQQGELDIEISRLAGQLAEREQQLAAVSEVAAAGSTRIAELECALRDAKKEGSDLGHLKDKVKNLSTRLADEAARTSEALAAAEAARQQAAVLKGELAAAQATARTVPALQTDLSKARATAEASAAEVAALRCEGEGLRSALHNLEGRLAEYQEKDTEVYLRIKEAMECAEEARLERDAARTETDSLQVQLAATQARLQEATRQLSGGGVDGGPSYKELRQNLAAAEEQLEKLATQEEAQAAKVSELRLTVERLVRDKSSLKAELAGVREELELYAFKSGKTASMAERLAEVERARDDALAKLDSQQRAAARADREWELERQQLQADIQRLAKRVASAEDAAAAAAAASAEAQQAAASAESELSSLKASRARVESELRQQLSELRQERDAEVAALVQKLERALATCDKSVVDAEQMLSAKDSLLRRWKQEAQLIASKLEVALQQHQAELAERQAQVVALTQQLAIAHEQQEMLQQELDSTRLTCQEAELLLGEAESRAAAANASAVAQQDDIMQELRSLQTQLERSQLDKVRAERARDGVAAKLGRMMMAGASPAAAAAAAAAALSAGCDGLGSGMGSPDAAGAGASSRGSSRASSPSQHLSARLSPTGATAAGAAATGIGGSNGIGSCRVGAGGSASAAGLGLTLKTPRSMSELHQKDQTE